MPWKADYVEALVGAGQTQRAIGILEELEWQGRAAQSRWAAASSLRCRTLLGENNWENIGQEALVALNGLPIEQGRAHLVLGERYRRHRRTSEARRHLKAAAEIFASCGANPWAARAQRSWARLAHPPNGELGREDCY